MEMSVTETTEIKWVWVCKSACPFHSVLLKASLFFQAYFQTALTHSQGCNKQSTSPSESLWSLFMTPEAVSMLYFLVEVPRVCCTPSLLLTSPVPLPQLWLLSHSFLQQVFPVPKTSLFLRQAATLPQWWAMWRYKTKHLGSHVEDVIHTVML